MRNFFRLWIVTLFIKLILASLIPISADEAYYWVWAKNLQLSYYDHPPLVSWLFWLGDFFKHTFGQSIRWPGVFLGHLLLIVWWLIWKKISPDSLDGNKFKNWFWLVLFNPLLGFGSLIVTPDLPVLFFWSLSLLFLIRVFQFHHKKDYLALGLVLGLGFCAKYHIVLFVPSLLFYLWFEKKWQEVRWSFVPLTIISGLVASLPVLLWNYQNDWISFRFQLNHGFSRPSYEFYWTWSYILGQILAISPLVFWKFISANNHGPRRLVSYFAYFPLLFFLGSSFSALVEANWPVIAYPAIFAIAALHIQKRWLIWTTNLFWGFVYLAMTLLLIIPNSIEKPEKLTESAEMQFLIAETKGFDPLYLSTYQMASYFWYLKDQASYKLYGTSRKDFYDSLPGARPGAPTFFFLANSDTDVPEWISKDPTFESRIEKEIGSKYRLFKIQRKQP